ncbi:MAG: hypothetical protein V9F05_03880 [Chitinophagaceae bacterium]|nr:hypothetical protein [Bacteroidota bacterium]
MNKFFTLITMSFVLFACNQNSQKSQDEIKTAIQQELDKCVEAVNSKNITLYMSLIPTDFELTNENGQIITREEQQAFILRDWSIIDTTLHNVYVVDSIHVFPDSVIAFTSQKWERLMFQRDGLTKDTVITTQLHRETWRYNSSGWMNYGITELGGKIYINGELYIE